MQRYEKYKDSGIEWIGEIPEHWGIKKLKYANVLIMGQSPDSTKCNQSQIGMPFLQGNAEFGLTFPEEKNWCTEPKKIVKENDILVSVRAPIGAVNIADKKFGIGRGLCAIRSKCYKYHYYLSLSFREELERLGTGSTFKAVSTEQVENVFLPLPPPDEQTAIADYLDRKTAEIDELIVKKEQLLKLYEEEKTAIINQAVTKGINPDVKMKDSGIEWLGDPSTGLRAGIPEHWEVKKLKWIIKIGNGEGIKSEMIKDFGKYPVYGGNGILGYTEEFNNNDNVFVIGRVGAKCGNIRLVDGPKWISDNALVAYSTGNLEYLFYSIQNLNLNNLSNKNAQPLITSTMVKEQSIFLPPPKEQTAIVAHIEKETARIDAKVEKTKKLIELLKEFRTALISEAVTGKIKIIENG
ncbi:restriction endonuclease subunit S [bacterium]|nr:restriction endonuclease subunit S [bacterium]